MKVLNQKSGVCEVANVAKVGVVSALIGAGLFFSGCGGDSTSKAEAVVKKKYPDAKILNYDEAKKELGVTTEFKKCFDKIPEVDFNGVDFTTYVFAKLDNEVKVYEISFPKNSDTPYDTINSYTIEQFKTSNAFEKCRD